MSDSGRGIRHHVQLPHESGMSQVVILDSLMPDFERWLHERQLFLFPIPVGDPEDLRTYGVSPTRELFDAQERRIFGA